MQTTTPQDPPGPRLAEVLDMLARNASRREIAGAVGCSTTTIDRDLAALRRQLGASNNIQLVVHAVRAGWI